MNYYCIIHDNARTLIYTLLRGNLVLCSEDDMHAYSYADRCVAVQGR